MVWIFKEIFKVKILRYKTMTRTKVMTKTKVITKKNVMTKTKVITKTKESNKMKMATHTAQRRTATAMSCASCNE